MKKTVVLISCFVYIILNGFTAQADAKPKAAIFGNAGKSMPQINILDFGAKPNSAEYSDESFKQALATIKNGGTLHIPSGEFRIKEDLIISGRNLKIIGPGTIFIEDNGKRDNIKIKITGENIEFQGVRVGSNAKDRTGVYGLLTAVDAKNIKFVNLDISGSPSTAIYTINTQDVLISRCHIHDTKADGIHISRASQDVIIENCLIERTGDDCIGLISYTDGGKYGQNRHIIVRNNILRDDFGITARGVASTSSDVLIENNLICGLSKGGIWIGRCTGAWESHFPENVIIRKNRIYNIGYGPMVDNFSGIAITGGRGIEIYENEISDIKADGISVCYSATDVKIYENQISTSRRGVRLAPRSQPDRNNEIIAFLYPNTPNPPKIPRIERINIEKNYIAKCSVGGIICEGKIDSPLKTIIIKDNILYRNLTGNHEEASDIFIRNAEQVIVKNNYSVDMGPEQKPQPWVYFQEFDNVKDLEYEPYKP